jgi:hypothetical protein
MYGAAGEGAWLAIFINESSTPWTIKRLAA